MDIISITLIDGTRYKMNEPLYNSKVVSIQYNDELVECLVKTSKGMTIRIPYHAILLYIEE